MSKNTWINVQGTWKAVTNVWVNVGGIWKSKATPKVNVGGIWKDFIQYMFSIYDNGIERISIVQGRKPSSYSIFQKNADNIFLQSYVGTIDDEVTLVTNVMVDVTEYTKVCVEWAASDKGSYFIIASTDKLSASNVFNTKFSKTGSFTKTVDYLDVSSLTGSFYIRCHAVTTMQGIGKINIHKIWLE